ncbi:MAG: hypothetical protein L0H15_03215 [Nitrosospira sp.]|nr:hypothetical protein [Nitrosospira sp.]
MPNDRLEAVLRAIEGARRPGESENVETRSALTSAGVEVKDMNAALPSPTKNQWSWVDGARRSSNL